MTVGRGRAASPAALAVIALIVIGLGTWIVLNSAFFDIRDVRVVGARNVSEEDILRLASIQRGTNLILLDTGDVAIRLREDPWIRDAFVERDLPTTAVIRVVERRPGGWVEGPDGFAIVSGDGTILEPADAAPSRLPAIGSWPGALIPGERVGGLDLTLRVTASMAPALLHEVASAGLEGSDVILQLRAGGSVMFGTPSQIDAKNQALVDMLRWAEGEGIAIRSIDVRVPAAPSLQPVRGPRISPIPTS
jgi:cell division protein FtsQ